MGKGAIAVHKKITGDVSQITLNPKENPACIAQWEFITDISGKDKSAYGRDISYFVDNPTQFQHVADVTTNIKGLQTTSAGVGFLLADIVSETWSKNTGLKWADDIGTLFVFQMQSYNTSTTGIWSVGLYTSAAAGVGGPALAVGTASNAIQTWVGPPITNLNITVNPGAVSYIASGTGIVPADLFGCSYGARYRPDNDISFVNNSNEPIAPDFNNLDLYVYPCWPDTETSSNTMDSILHAVAVYRVPQKLTFTQIDAILAEVTPYWLNKQFVSPLTLAQYF